MIQGSNLSSWPDFFPFALWSLWINRNHNTFNNKSSLLLPSVVKNKTLESCCYSNHAQNPQASDLMSIKWSPPTTRTFKLNTNGSFSKDRSKGGTGGVIRDHNG
ncbi:hypothetical protein RDI58_026851 [Solanum bulbocastanum]|uniref:Uncharacterized protein n=1 Tax=Solanum bulbocastanum TaxID=147425 RepID=A0AAN8SUE3_SOLBU